MSKIDMNNRRPYQFIEPQENKKYNIQVVDIRPGDTILFHLNDDIDLDSVAVIMEEMGKTFPNNTIIPINEWILKGMTILRKAEKVGDCVDEIFLDKPLELMYPDLFTLDKGTAVPEGKEIW